MRSALSKYPILAALAIAVFVSFSVRASGERLPVKTYTTADGLLRDSVFRIKQDSRGYLWLCTGEGLSRFDGYKFTNYTMSDGLPLPSVNDVVEASDGTIWIATYNGLVRFNAAGVRAPYSPQANQTSNLMFQVFAPGDSKFERDISVLLADENGLVWLGTRAGVYRMQVKEGQPQFERAAPYQTTSLIKDHLGGLWVGTFSDGLYRLSADRANILEHLTSKEGLPRNYGTPSPTISALLEDKEGNIWVGTRSGVVCQLAFDSRSGRHVVSRCYDKREGLPHDWVNSIFQSSDGSLWICSTSLIRVSRGDAIRKLTLQPFGATQGFCDDGVNDIAEDRDGNFWIATACGLEKWTLSGFTTYHTQDGLSSSKINSLLETIDGELVVTDHDVARTINLFSNGTFKGTRPNYPSYIGNWGWGWRQTVLQSRDGEWWVPVGMSDEYKKRFKEMPPDGALVVRFPKVKKPEDLAHVSPKAVYRPRDGLLGYDTFRLYEDRNGDIWIVTLDITRLFKWERKTGKFHELTEAADLGDSGYIYAFREDRAGNLWIGAGMTFRHDENQTFSLMRYKDGRFTWFTAADGLPEGTVKDLLIDGVGRLWIATSRGGVLRVDDTNSEGLRFIAYTTEQGLSDNTTSSLTEDRFGRIYIGSGRGVDRLDPATGTVKHFTTADGLPREEILASYRDRTGALWFGSNQGLARYVPDPEDVRDAPNILLTGLRVSNVEQRVSALGEMELPRFEFEAGQNNLSVDFLGLGTSLGEELRYKYKLEGANADWTTTGQRTINFSNLAPGTYRFLVTAITAEGIESVKPASFTFTILRPVWLRWWFLLIVTAIVIGAVCALYRYRVAQLIKLERVRTRIASDLHDDIGASLSRMAILSEVVKRQVGATPDSVPMLTEIADSARGLVGSMRDIVWSIDPRRDDLSNLVSRVRQFASDVLEPKGISWEFEVPPRLVGIKLDPDERRHLFLIFKEAINNLARHARCRSVSMKITIEHGTLSAEVRDDGRGFSTLAEASSANGGEGHGLENMRARAAQLGGELAIRSSPGLGTTVQLMVPFRKR